MQTHQNSLVYPEDFVDEGLDWGMELLHLVELLLIQRQVVWHLLWVEGQVSDVTMSAFSERCTMTWWVYWCCFKSCTRIMILDSRDCQHIGQVR